LTTLTTPSASVWIELCYLAQEHERNQQLEADNESLRGIVEQQDTDQSNALTDHLAEESRLALQLANNGAELEQARVSAARSMVTLFFTAIGSVPTIIFLIQKTLSAFSTPW
jgi:hypothetical protein